MSWDIAEAKCFIAKPHEAHNWWLLNGITQMEPGFDPIVHGGLAALNKNLRQLSCPGRD